MASAHNLESEDWPWAAWGVLGVVLSWIFVGPFVWFAVTLIYGLTTDFFDSVWLLYVILAFLALALAGWRIGVQYGANRRAR